MKITSRKAAIRKGLNKYYTGKTCKYRHTCERFVCNRICVKCQSDHNKKNYAKNGKQLGKQRQQRWARSKGYGVYRATFPSGTYIGRGHIALREYGHLNKQSHIALKLNEEAHEFVVLRLCNSVKEAKQLEYRTIKHYKLRNLLNSIAESD